VAEVKRHVLDRWTALCRFTHHDDSDKCSCSSQEGLGYAVLRCCAGPPEIGVVQELIPLTIGCQETNPLLDEAV